MNKKLKELIKAVLPRSVINRIHAVRHRFWIRKILRQKTEPYQQGCRPAGVNLYGDFELGTGLSRSVNLLKAELETAGVPYSLHQVEEFSGKPAGERPQTDYAVNVFHLQPEIVPHLFDRIPIECRSGHYNIAHWAWETPTVPKEWQWICPMFDEIWTPSAFAADAVRKVTDRPVFVFSPAVFLSDRKRPSPLLLKEKYGIPEDAFLCLVIFDGRSVLERKNPEAAIRVFRKAFPDLPEDVWLMIKGKGIEAKEKEKLDRLLAGTERVLLVEGKLEYKEMEILLAGVDVLISLHRAEGFGLPVAEVMNYGGVALTTDYSSTTEFANEQNACPVSYELIRTKKDYGPYPAGTAWAEPDEEDAARKLRRLYEDPQWRKRLGEAAKKTIEEQLSDRVIGEKVKQRVDMICGGNRA